MSSGKCRDLQLFTLWRELKSKKLMMHLLCDILKAKMGRNLWKMHVNFRHIMCIHELIAII